MTDSELIWKFLLREVTDNHPVIYLYLIGNAEQNKTAINKTLDLTKKIFSPVISETLMLGTIKAFLIFKKNQYSRGKFSISSIY
jgi:hypothetical protein